MSHDRVWYVPLDASSMRNEIAAESGAQAMGLIGPHEVVQE